MLVPKGFFYYSRVVIFKGPTLSSRSLPLELNARTGRKLTPLVSGVGWKRASLSEFYGTQFYARNNPVQ